MTLDPVRLALVQKRLDFISRHMGWVMTRTARSPIFSQSHDFSCFLTDGAGTLVSNADGIPIHTGGGGFAVRALLSAFDGAAGSGTSGYGTVGEGDVFLLNDPYAAGGNHLPDWVIARPVFAEGHLVAFVCNRAHQSDIGGGAAGTYNPEATEIFHEGLRLPPLRLVEAGSQREDLWQLLLLNSRTPDLLDGDLRAMIGSTRIGAEHVSKLVMEIGVDPMRAYLDGILDHADRCFREVVSRLPDGLYEGSEMTHSDCFEPGEIEIRVALTVKGDSLHLDFSGTGDQVRGFKNSSLANTHSAVYMALASFFDPELPRNEGTFRCLEIHAPKGSIVNPRPPAPVTMCTVFVAHEIVHAVWKALAKACPEDSCAGWGKPIHGVTASTSGPDEPFVMYHWNALAGAGAVDGRDGFNQIGHLIALGGLTLPELEVFEQLYPVHFVRHEFRSDAAGVGRFRGGTGVEYEVDVQVGAQYSFRGEGLSAPSGYGAAGGGTGKKGEMTMYPVNGEAFAAPTYGLRDLGPARLSASSPAGGGWGDPLERDSLRVLRDVRDEVLSDRAAKSDYGVVLREGGLEVDEEATVRQRARMRQSTA